MTRAEEAHVEVSNSLFLSKAIIKSHMRLRSPTMMLCLGKRRPDTFRISAKHHFVQLALVSGKDEIQEDPDDCGNDEWGLYNQIKALLEALQVHIWSTIIENLIEPRWCDDVDKSNTECDGQDEAISSSELDHSEYSDTGNDDCAVEKDLHPAEDRRRHGRKDGAEFGKEPHENQEHGGGPSRATGLEYPSQ